MYKLCIFSMITLDNYLYHMDNIEKIYIKILYAFIKGRLELFVI